MLSKKHQFKFDKRGLHAGRIKAENSVIIFLRTEKINLNAFLHKQKVPGYTLAAYEYG